MNFHNVWVGVSSVSTFCLFFFLRSFTLIFSLIFVSVRRWRNRFWFTAWQKFRVSRYHISCVQQLRFNESCMQTYTMLISCVTSRWHFISYNILFHSNSNIEKWYPHTDIACRVWIALLFFAHSIELLKTYFYVADFLCWVIRYRCSCMCVLREERLPLKIIRTNQNVT